MWTTTSTTRTSPGAATRSEEGAWWVDGDLHDLADDGWVYRYHEAESFPGEDSYLTAVGGTATGAIYVAATFGDDAPPAMWRFLPR